MNLHDLAEFERRRRRHQNRMLRRQIWLLIGSTLAVLAAALLVRWWIARRSDPGRPTPIIVPDRTLASSMSDAVAGPRTGAGEGSPAPAAESTVPGDRVAGRSAHPGGGARGPDASLCQAATHRPGPVESNPDAGGGDGLRLNLSPGAIQPAAAMSADREPPPASLHPRDSERPQIARIPGDLKSAKSAESAEGVRLLLDAIRAEESRGDDRAVGDGGASRGPYQIQRAYWADALEGSVWAASLDYDRDVWDARSCEIVIVRYWARYAPAALADEDLQVLARVHNGGPDGASEPETLDYWPRVAARMIRR